MRLGGAGTAGSQGPGEVTGPAEPRVPDRWEAGSEYSFPLEVPMASRSGEYWIEGKRLFNSGRDALRRLIDHGQETRGWRRLFLPSYFCQDVVGALIDTGISVRAYPMSPVRAPCFEGVGLGLGDVVLHVNYFGTFRWDPYEELSNSGVEVIEDHTHDPWSPTAASTRADWALASLRKTLPLPDGAALWSPRGHEVPAPTGGAETAEPGAMLKLGGMVLKGRYLRGDNIEKEVFRTLLAEGEAVLEEPETRPISRWSRQALRGWPLEEWRVGRRRNHDHAARALDDAAGVRVLTFQRPEGTVPFSLVLEFETAEVTTRARRTMIAAALYPARLWQLDYPALEGIPTEDVDLSRRILSVHCDLRYGADDMDRIVKIVRASLTQ